MPLQKLQFRPGVNREGTTLANEGGWFECDKVRFRSGYPEKIGGWVALSYSTFQGICRSLWNWVTLKGFNLIGVGTNLKFYVENGGSYYDITPIRLTTTNTTTFSTVSGSPIVTVTDASVSGIQAGDFVTFSGATTVGGLNLNGEYQITSVTSATVYTITASSNASSTTTGGGGAVSSAYQINVGAATYGFGNGWGTGPWPLYTVTTLTGPFATTNTSTTVTVTQTAHGLTSGDYVFFASISSSTVNGIKNSVMLKAFQVTVVNANSYTISTVIDNLSYPATSTGSGAGGTVVVYTPAGTARGWGSAFNNSGFGIQLRLWSQSNFGEYLLFCPRGGALYLWQPGAGNTPAFGTRATQVTTGDTPVLINQIMVSDSSRITIAFGCNDYGTPTVLDPLLIRWSAQESYTDWTFTGTGATQAGFYRLSHGSQIIGALQTRQEILVWTDSAIYSMQYLGPPYVWGFNLLADNISIASPNCTATAAGVTYWMGTDKFYVYSGRVETLPCSLRAYVFDDINRQQQFQFFAGTNEGYSEIWWFYCSANSDVIDRYVIFNYLDRVWYYGTLGRTAWIDSPILDFPAGATYNNLLVLHEASVDDGSTNPPSPIDCYVQSSDFDIGDGHNYGFVWRMIPDITFDGSTNPKPSTPQVTFTMRPRQNPGAPYGVTNSPVVSTNQSYATKHVYNVQEFTEIVYTRVRGRQMAFRVESNTLGTQWQLGVPRLDVRPDGRRA